MMAIPRAPPGPEKHKQFLDFLASFYMQLLQDLQSMICCGSLNIFRGLEIEHANIVTGRDGQWHLQTKEELPFEKK